MRQTAAWRLPGAGAGEGLHQGFGEHSGDQGPGQERASIRDSGEHSGDQGSWGRRGPPSGIPGNILETRGAGAGEGLHQGFRGTFWRPGAGAGESLHQGFRGTFWRPGELESALNWTLCECHHILLEKQDILTKPRNNSRPHRQAGFKRMAGKALRGARGPSSFGSGSLGHEPHVPAPSRPSCMGKVGDVSQATPPLAFLSWGCLQGEAG